MCRSSFHFILSRPCSEFIDDRLSWRDIKQTLSLYLSLSLEREREKYFLTKQRKGAKERRRKAKELENKVRRSSRAIAYHLTRDSTRCFSWFFVFFFRDVSSTLLLLLFLLLFSFLPIHAPNDIFDMWTRRNKQTHTNGRERIPRVAVLVSHLQDCHLPKYVSFLLVNFLFFFIYLFVSLILVFQLRLIVYS